MGASEARKARRAKGLASSPTIGADLGDSGVSRRKVVATQAPLSVDDPENAKLTIYEPIQEEKSNRQTNARGQVVDPGSVFKVIAQGVASDTNPVHPSHIGIANIAADVRNEIKSAAFTRNPDGTKTAVMDASKRAALQKSMAVVDSSLRASVLHHYVNDRASATAALVQAGNNLKSVIRAVGRETLGNAFINYPVDPAMLVDHHVNSYLGS